MKLRLIYLLFIAILTSCGEKDDMLDLEFHTMLPCHIGTFKHGEFYTINYHDYVQILKNGFKKPIYPELNHKETFLISFKFINDSVENVEGKMLIDVNNYIRLFADTLKGQFHKVGNYYFYDYKIDSVVLNKNSVDFRIFFGDEEYNRICNAQIVHLKNIYYLKLDNNFLGDLVTRDNPMYSFSKNGFSYHRLDTNRKALFDTKIEFYKNHLESISDLVLNESIQGVEKQGLNYSFKYLNRLIELYEGVKTTEHNTVYKQ